MAGDRLHITPRLLAGGFIILLGVFFTLDNLNILDFGQAFRLWPLALIVIGLVTFMQAKTTPGHVAGGAWLAVGTLLLLSSLRILPFRIWDLWPLILVFAGGYVVWQALGGDSQRLAGAAPSSSISALAVMGGVHRSSNALDFRGGELTAIMGGCEVDLTRASIQNGEAVIDVFAVWGGIDIRVPQDWTVIGKVVPLLGAFEDKTVPPADGGLKRLVVRGVVVMGGVEVKN